MQTFLPYQNISRSLKCLDNKRLGKQRVEAKQILNSIFLTDTWSNHPAVRMWKGYENALRLYLNMAIYEWIQRGKNNNMPYEKIEGDIVFPPWFEDYKIFESHKCNLLRKNFDFYSKIFGTDHDIDAPYWWPCGLKNNKNHQTMMKYWTKHKK